jgi:uncharacterized protein (DUF305 family)
MTMGTCRAAAILLCAAAAASCRTAAPAAGAATVAEPKPPIVQPGAPGEPSQVITADKASDLSRVQYVGADIKFMQGMIGHHTQAVEMVALVPSRSNREDVRSLAHRIDLSQQDEIKMMQVWLQTRGQPVPAPGAMHVHGATLMPGMLTEEEMAKLADARGDDFDRLFLLGMIKHHSGALTMVQELFSSPGAGQEVETFAFASDVESDQRMEIDRMGAMLDEVMRKR